MKVPESPVGPFTLAQMRLVVRAGIRPRAYCLGAVCDCDAATEALREGWGYPVQHGRRAPRRAPRPDLLHGLARRARGDGGGRRPTPSPSPAPTCWPSTTCTSIRLGDAGSRRIVQVEPRVRHPRRRPGPAGAATARPAGALGMSGGIRLTMAMTGFTFRADTTLPAVRFLMDPNVPRRPEHPQGRGLRADAVRAALYEVTGSSDVLQVSRAARPHTGAGRSARASCTSRA